MFRLSLLLALLALVAGQSEFDKCSNDADCGDLESGRNPHCCPSNAVGKNCFAIFMCCREWHCLPGEECLYGIDGLPDNLGKCSETGSSFCFSAKTQVQVQARGQISMNELKVGDHVQAGNGKFEEVYAFGHHEPDASATFLQIYTENQKLPLEMTANHLVFLANGHSVPAGTVIKGDVLLLDGANKAAALVTDIKTFTRTGVFAPLTISGRIVVNGIVASSYVAVDANPTATVLGMDTGMSWHWVGHMSFAPYRLAAMWRPHVSTAVAPPKFPLYVEVLKDTFEWIPTSTDPWVQYLMWPLGFLSFTIAGVFLQAFEMAIASGGFMMITSIVMCLLLHRGMVTKKLGLTA